MPSGPSAPLKQNAERIIPPSVFLVMTSKAFDPFPRIARNGAIPKDKEIFREQRSEAYYPRVSSTLRGVGEICLTFRKYSILIKRGRMFKPLLIGYK
jgi:hypothetical protein